MNAFLAVYIFGGICFMAGYGLGRAKSYYIEYQAFKKARKVYRITT